jgi:hypothetical protein
VGHFDKICLLVQAVVTGVRGLLHQIVLDVVLLQAGPTVRRTMLRKITSLINTKYARKAANPRAADRPAGGWPPKGRIIRTP